MKKAGVVIFIAIIILSWQVSAIIGVSPGIYEVNFEPGLKESYLFSYTFDEGVKSEVYAEGDLAEYVTLSTDSLVGGGQVIATIELPGYIEEPGNHRIFIGAMQKAEEEEGGVGVGLVGNVRGVILVKVPYPGKYALISEFYADNANQGEPINLTLHVNSLGDQGITANAFVEIFDESNSSLEIVHLGTDYLEPREKKIFRKQFQTTNSKAGDYIARAIVKYDAGELTKEAKFRLGTLYVGISNYTEEFTKNKINRFDIEIESFWNNKIKNVYSKVNIIGSEIEFLTPSLDLSPWQKTVLSGFFDASEIEEDRFQANITLYYSDKTTNKIVDLKFRHETDYLLYAIIFGGVFIGILVISVIIVTIVLIIRLRKPLNKNQREQKNIKNSKSSGYNGQKRK